MDNKLSSNVVIGIPMISTRGLLLSKPYQPICAVSTTSKTNVKLGPKLLQIVKHKLSYGVKILPIGREGRIFSKNFNTTPCEKLLHASRCYIYTTAGPIAGTLFISTERVGFCSDRAIKTYSVTLEVFKFQYKVSIPLGKIKGAGENMNTEKPSNKYVELVTVDNFNFWFLGFPSYKKTLSYLRQSISSN
uniref:GEM-like protein 6 n=1 Tax=Erigeron canadensis TaxID=72917 RepID=UPI001CB94012|nr:GEM-like protein 6 [Erigeron canadensis]